MLKQKLKEKERNLLCDLIVVTPEAHEMSCPTTMLGSCDSCVLFCRNGVGFKGSTAAHSAVLPSSTVGCLFPSAQWP